MLDPALSKRRMDIEAVVFDCDGLLLDTEEYWTRGETALFARYGRVFTSEDKARLLGPSGWATGRILAEHLGQKGRERELAVELLECSWHEVAQGAHPRAGAAELVGRLRGHMSLGVASNSPKELLTLAITNAGFGDFFDVILGADEVSSPKPAPDVYRAACEALRAQPHHAVALEDSPPEYPLRGRRACGLSAFPRIRK